MAAPVVVVARRSRLIVSKERGPQGPTGVGVPVGGTAGQVLSKIDASNFNTSWIDMTGGGGGGTTLTALTDTTITGVAANDLLKWSGTKWTNFPMASLSIAWGQLTSVPTTFAPASHQHLLADITDSGTAAPLNVAASGDAAVGDVVMGNDSRLADSRTPTTHQHPATDIVSGVFANALVQASNVTQHQAALSITESQISDLQAYLTDLSSQSTTNLAEGTNLYFTDERVDDRVAALLVAGANITLAYNDVANSLTVSSVDTNTDTIAALTDTTITGVAANDLLKWSGTKWTNFPMASLSIAWGQLTSVPTTFAPASHQHLLADITDSGTAAPLNVAASGDAAVGEVVKGDDTRLSDARTPLTHTHTAADTTSGVFNRVRVPDMIGASAFAAGSEGQVPAPQIADRTKFLKGNGAWDVPTNTDTHKLAEVRATVDGSGSPTTAVIVKGYVEEAATINAASLVADVSGSIVATVKRDRGGTIVTLGTIALTTALSVRDTTLTGWTTDLAVGDIVIFEFAAATTLTRATATLGRTAA